MRTIFNFILLSFAVLASVSASAGTKHSPASRFPTYESRIMCGYQGWFRAEGDGSGEGWEHYSVSRKLDVEHLKVDLWPDVSEYVKTYLTPFTFEDGTPARLFSPWDQSTVDLHFHWMQEYGIDGVFMQRFYNVTHTPETRAEGRVVLGHALKASQQYGRAIAVMYDLSGLKPGQNCDSIIQDWKELVDQLHITSQGTNQTYLYHRGKPLVAIWGLGFPDRVYNIRDIGLMKLIDFLKNDPQYGGCSILLGVPTYFRDLDKDCLPDSYLHRVMASADIIMPWMVGRFNARIEGDTAHYAAEVKADLAWCAARNLDYAPCVFPGFSNYNLSRHEAGRPEILDFCPRQGGEFYWTLMNAALCSGAKIIYVAMFDEIDEGTAIFKCADKPPLVAPPGKLLGYGDVPADHYLWLTGQAGQILRGEKAPDKDLYQKSKHELTKTAKR
jgi:hypothetical protein